MKVLFGRVIRCSQRGGGHQSQCWDFHGFYGNPQRKSGQKWCTKAIPAKTPLSLKEWSRWLHRKLGSQEQAFFRCHKRPAMSMSPKLAEKARATVGWSVVGATSPLAESAPCRGLQESRNSLLPSGVFSAAHDKAKARSKHPRNHKRPFVSALTITSTSQRRKFFVKLVTKN